MRRTRRPMGGSAELVSLPTLCLAGHWYAALVLGAVKRRACSMRPSITTSWYLARPGKICTGMGVRRTGRQKSSHAFFPEI